MVIARLLFLILAIASVVSFVRYMVSGEVRHRQRGLFFVKAGVGAGLLFFLVLAIERLWNPF